MGWNYLSIPKLQRCNIVLASHLCTCVLHRQLCYLHTLKLPQFFHFHGDFHQKWHFAHPEVSFAHPELPFLAKSMRCNRWSLRMDKQFHATLYWEWYYLFKLSLRLYMYSQRAEIHDEIILLIIVHFWWNMFCFTRAWFGKTSSYANRIPHWQNSPGECRILYYITVVKTCHILCPYSRIPCGRFCPLITPNNSRVIYWGDRRVPKTIAGNS